MRVYVNGKERLSPKEFKDPLMAAVFAMELGDLNAKDFPLMVFSSRKRLLFNNKKFPDLCLENCQPLIHLKECPCMKMKMEEEAQRYICPFGLEIYDIPIKIDGGASALLKGGFVLNRNHAEGIMNVEPLAKSTEHGIQTFLSQIADGIEEMIRFYKMRNTMREHEVLLDDKEKNIQTLFSNLQSEKRRSVDLKINHHFLFNILNYFASEALTGDREDLYSGIIDLSKMFRFSSGEEYGMATFAEELEYVTIYLRLQSRRYGDELRILTEISPAISDIRVPFNFLQPIVENAFSHGFMEFDDEKMIRIQCLKKGSRAEIAISNNGNMIDMAGVAQLHRHLTSGSRNGLSLIYQKLEMAYGEHFDMWITSSFDLTTVHLSIPLEVN